MVKTVCGDEIAQKLNLISLSDNTIKRLIDNMTENILQQLINELLIAKEFSIQIDESIDIENHSQLMVFVR